jgi:hypothetical protein
MFFTHVSSRPLVRNPLLLTALSFMLVCGLSGICGAQNFVSGTGSPPFITQVSGEFDSLNLPYGGVHVQLPMRSKAGKYPLSLRLSGDSLAHVGSTTNQGNIVLQWGPSFDLLSPTLSGSSLATALATGVGSTTTKTIECGTSFNGLEGGWVVGDANGTVHPFPAGLVVANGPCGAQSGSGVTTDESGYTIQVVTGTVGQGYVPQVTSLGQRR